MQKDVLTIMKMILWGWGTPKCAPGGSFGVIFGEFEHLNAVGAILWWELRFHLLGQLSDNNIIKGGAIFLLT